jgi:6-phosphofructokinase
MPVNAVVATSGGPTAVINNSVHGVLEGLARSGEIGTVYGAQMGILGVLQDRLIDLTAQDPRQIELLAHTPSAGALGSCRYKLASKAVGVYTEDYERIIQVCRARDIGCFFYIGGNDSMDTADRVAAAAREAGLELRAIGVAKTVDNDVGGGLRPDGTFAICDHNPGYGSVARYWAVNVLEANEENRASHTSDPVLIMQAMGRKIGFITASARLGDPERRMPLLIVMPEALCKDDAAANLERVTDGVNAMLRERGRCMVVVCEGANLGDVGVLLDSFGHAQFSASRTTAAQLLMNHLNGVDRADAKGRARTRLVVPGIARVDVPGTIQRRDIGRASEVDLQEAYEVGLHAAKLALAGRSGLMATILRKPGDNYGVKFGEVPLSEVANAERTFPQEWISEDGLDVTDGFVRWARPLIGRALPEFAQLDEIAAPPCGLGDYAPRGMR